MSQYEVTLKIRVEAESSASAFDIGYGAFEHLLDTFNDNESIGRNAVVEVKPLKENPQ